MSNLNRKSRWLLELPRMHRPSCNHKIRKPQRAQCSSCDAAGTRHLSKDGMACMAGGAPPSASLLPGLAAGLAAKEGAPPAASQPELAQGTLSGACRFWAYRVISFHRLFWSLKHPRADRARDVVSVCQIVRSLGGSPVMFYLPASL